MRLVGSLQVIRECGEYIGRHRVIVVAKGHEKSLEFRVPEPVPPWVYAAAVMRAKNRAQGLKGIEFDDG